MTIQEQVMEKYPKEIKERSCMQHAMRVAALRERYRKQLEYDLSTEAERGAKVRPHDLPDGE